MKWDRRSKIILLEELEMYLSAGLTLAQSLKIISGRMTKKRQVYLHRMIDATESGQNLSRVLASEIKLPSSIVGLISCGETSGSLSRALKESHLVLESEDELMKKVISSMTYPVVIGLATIALTIGLIQGIMPQIIPLLTGLHVALPLLTRIVMGFSEWFIDHGLITLVVTVLIVGTSVFAYRKIERLRFFVQSTFLKLPIMGKLLRNYSLSLFFRSFGAMIEAGVLADIAFERSADSVSLLPLRRKLKSQSTSLQNGSRFAVIATNMPAYVGSLISAGETSGTLGSSLNRISTILSREIDHALKRLTALVEPIMMIGMGSIVGSIALSIMMPIYDISKTLQR